jgi:flagellar basal body-associated protein FliL
MDIMTIVIVVLAVVAGGAGGYLWGSSGKPQRKPRNRKPKPKPAA